MSSEVCPFCGKTYKRLKSHLPHCKAAVSSKTSPSKHDITADQTTASSQLAASPTKPTAQGEKSTQTISVTASKQSKKSKKVSAVSSQPQSSSPAASSQSANTSPLSQPLSPSSASLTPSTKKKKQKLSEQIKTAASTTSPLTPTQSQTQSKSPPLKPKKKSLRDLIEAAKSKQVPEGSVEGTRSASEDLPSGSAPSVADPLTITAQTDTQNNPEQNLGNLHPAFVSTGAKPKGGTASKMNLLKKKRVEQSLSIPKETSSTMNSNVNESSAKLNASDDFLVDNKGEMEDLSMNKMSLKSRSGHQAKITLQDVKATLGRAKSVHQSSRPSILSQTGTTGGLNSKFKPGTGTGLSSILLPNDNQENVHSCLVTTKTLSDQLPSTRAKHTELNSVKKKSSKSKQSALIPLRHDVSSQTELTSPAAPLLPGQLLSQVSQARSLPQTLSMNERLKVGHHLTELPAVSTSHYQFSSPDRFLLAPQTLPARLKLRADDGLTMEKSQLEVKTKNTADNHCKGAVAQQSLGQVRLRDLPKWLACKTPSHPKDVVEMVQRGWHWYYKRYIDVKKGGVGGLSMLLAGYCVLSYIWNYPHIKRDRWRKHH